MRDSEYCYKLKYGEHGESDPHYIKNKEKREWRNAYIIAVLSIAIIFAICMYFNIGTK